MSDMSTPVGSPEMEGPSESGEIAVLDATKRKVNVEVYSAEGQLAKRPTLTVAERSAITDAMETALDLYQPQRLVLRRTTEEIQGIRQALTDLREKKSVKADHLAKIAELEEVLHQREMEHEQALYEVQQAMQATRHQAELQVANITHQAQMAAADIIQAGKKAIFEKDWQIKEIHQAASTEIQALEQSNAVLNQQLNYVASDQQRLQGVVSSLEGQLQTAAQRETDSRLATQAAEAQQQQMRSKIFQMGHQLKQTTDREAQLRTVATQLQQRADELTRQMAELSASHASVLNDMRMDNQLQVQRVAEKDNIIIAVQAQLAETEQARLLQTEQLTNELHDSKVAAQELQARLTRLEGIHEQMQREVTRLQAQGAPQQPVGQPQATNTPGTPALPTVVLPPQPLGAHIQPVAPPPRSLGVPVQPIVPPPVNVTVAADIMSPQFGTSVSTSGTINSVSHTLGRSVTTYDQPIVKGLAELMSHQHKQTIPIFSGYLHEVSWEDWIRDAERVARTAGWDNEMKVRFFGDRLKHMALAYHEEIVHRRPNPDYAYWKKTMAERFQDKSAKETYKRALEQLKQTPNQRVQDFGNQIDEMYKKAYGNSAATNTEPDAASFREDIKKKVLFVVLREPIINHMWLTPSASYEEHLKKAIDVEEMLRRRAQLLPMAPVATVANVSEVTDPLALILEKLSALGAGDQGTVNYVGQQRRDQQGKPQGKPKQADKAKETNSKRDVTCYNCQKKGHYKRECTAPKKQRKEPPKKDEAKDKKE